LRDVLPGLFPARVEEEGRITLGIFEDFDRFARFVDVTPFASGLSSRDPRR
jgi:hypothetical protein